MELKKRTKFFQGLILGLFITSTLSYAVVTFNTFTSGTTISSSQMNANFDVIKTKLDELDVGFIGSISTDVVVTCAVGASNPAFPGDYTPVAMTADYSDGNFASNIYTISSTGLYRFYFNAESEDSMSYYGSLDISTDGGASWTQVAMASMAPINQVLKFTAGNKLRVSAGCGDMYAGQNSTINSTKFMFALKKF